MLTAHQERLAQQLREYVPVQGVESDFRDRILKQVESTELWWHRETLPGHITASGFVVNQPLQQMLLHHHRKLDRWLQLGGHDDGERDPERVVLREIREESGLSELGFFGGRPAIFDLDIHPIPARGEMPAHDHLDIRYLVVADPQDTLQLDSEESHDLRWFPLEEVAQLMDEEGSHRVLQKIVQIRRQLES